MNKGVSKLIPKRMTACILAVIMLMTSLFTLPVGAEVLDYLTGEAIAATESSVIPQTGDPSLNSMFIGLGAFAVGGAIAGLILFIKKRRDDGDDDEC